MPHATDRIDAREQALDAAEHVLDELVPQRRVEDAYRSAVESVLSGVHHRVPHDADVIAKRSGAWVRVDVWVAEEDMSARILDQAPAT